VEVRDAIVSGRTTAEAACRAALDRIEADGDRLHAFQHVASERALARARALDRLADSPGPLHGVPVALKDNIVARELPTAAGSRVLHGYTSPYDATVVARLEAAGAVVVGTTTCDEFAMGSSTENASGGPAKNPWAIDRTPGGSSGGSAAAVAAGLVPLALGSDTGGSVRQPAAFCGVTGLKPTYGRVSRYGLIAFASSLDQIGPLARTVEDVAVCLDVIAGADARDATAAPLPPPVTRAVLNDEVTGLRIGVPRHLLARGVDSGVVAAFDAGLDTLAGLGARIETIELPHSEAGIAVYYLVATAEASSNLARYDGVRYGRREGTHGPLAHMYEATRRAGFGAEVKRRIMLGTYVLSAGYYDAYYLKAQKVRTLIRRDFERAFETVDLVALPTAPTPAFRLGERTADPLQMYLADVFTVGASLAGVPAISVPCGLTSERLPVGLQLIGRIWEDAALLRAASAYERARGPLPGPEPD
jgi:aspartyl-tRNA(Asn)/glutamyl-tRNA(Gln) amidotransferase subunit A